MYKNDLQKQNFLTPVLLINLLMFELKYIIYKLLNTDVNGPIFCVTSSFLVHRLQTKVLDCF